MHPLHVLVHLGQAGEQDALFVYGTPAADVACRAGDVNRYDQDLQTVPPGQDHGPRRLRRRLVRLLICPTTRACYIRDRDGGRIVCALAPGDV